MTPTQVFQCSSTSKCGTQQKQIFQYSKVTISPIQQCPMPSSTVISLTTTLQYSLILCSLYSVVTLVGWPWCGWLVLSIFPALKCFTHLPTQLVTIQESLYMWLSHPQKSTDEMFSLTRNSITAWWQNYVTWQPFCHSDLQEHLQCSYARPVFILQGTDVTTNTTFCVLLYMA